MDRKVRGRRASDRARNRHTFRQPQPGSREAHHPRSALKREADEKAAREAEIRQLEEEKVRAAELEKKQAIACLLIQHSYRKYAEKNGGKKKGKKGKKGKGKKGKKGKKK